MSFEVTSPLLQQLAALHHPDTAAKRSLQEGARLGYNERYVVEKLLGKGGFGEAYLALDTQLGRKCVIKRAVAPSNCPDTLWQSLREQFRHEAHLLVRVNAPGFPGIPDIYEYLEEADCLVMKYVVGQSLADLLAEQGRPFPVERALCYAQDVCAALVYLHTHGPEPLLHRDIKPANILLDERGQIWLIDFGLAKASSVQSPPDEKHSHAAGTPGYAPPEQWQGKAEPRSDVYALGATLFALLTGASPTTRLMSGSSWGNLIPANVLPLIERCLSPRVADRPTADQLQQALATLTGRSATPMPPPSLLPLPATEIVGREPELAALAERLERRGTAVLTGMAGLGKTSLATVLAGQLAQSGPVFWHGFRQGEAVDVILGKLAAFLAHQGWPQLWQALQHEPQRAPELHVDTLVSLLRGRSCVLCCDDLHWVEDDPLIVSLLRRLLSEAAAGRLRLLLISRHLPAFAPAGMAAPLIGLRRHDVRALCARHQLTLAESLEERLIALTEGNAQLLLLAIDALRTSDDQHALIEHLAHSRDVAFFLLDAVDNRLSPEEREVMGAVAVLGDYPGTSDVVEVVAERDQCRRVLDDLSRRSLLQHHIGPRGSEYGQHAIVQAHYYQNLGSRRRKTLHLRAAAFYEHEERDLLKAAHHSERAGAFDRAIALATYDLPGAINAGQARALARLLERLPAERMVPDQLAALHIARGELAALLGNYVLAGEALETALTTIPPNGDLAATEARARCYRLRALIHERVGEYDRAEAACRAGLTIAAGADVPYQEPARLQIQLAELLWRRSKLDEVERACDAGLELLPSEPAAPAERAALLQRTALVTGARGDYTTAIRELEHSLRLAKRSGDLMLVAVILHNLGLHYQRSGQSEQALTCYAESLRIKEQIGDVAGRVRTLINRGGLSQESGHYDAALACFAEARVLCEQHHLVEPLAEVAANSGLVCFMRRDFAGAEAHFAAALAIDRQLDNAAGLADTEYRLGDLRLAQGDAEGAEGHAVWALALARQIDSPVYSACALRVRSEALLAQGRLAEAAEALQQAEQYQLVVDDPYDRTLMLVAQARLAAAAGDLTGARQLVDEGTVVAREYRLPYQAGLLEALEEQLAGAREGAM